MKRQTSTTFRRGEISQSLSWLSITIIITEVLPRLVSDSIKTNNSAFFILPPFCSLYLSMFFCENKQGDKNFRDQEVSLLGENGLPEGVSSLHGFRYIEILKKIKL